MCCRPRPSGPPPTPLRPPGSLGRRWEARFSDQEQGLRGGPERGTLTSVPPAAAPSLNRDPPALPPWGRGRAGPSLAPCPRRALATAKLRRRVSALTRARVCNHVCVCWCVRVYTCVCSRDVHLVSIHQAQCFPCVCTHRQTCPCTPHVHACAPTRGHGPVYKHSCHAHSRACEHKRTSRVQTSRGKHTRPCARHACVCVSVIACGRGREEWPAPRWCCE